jgi:hypothetical protein
LHATHTKERKGREGGKEKRTSQLQGHVAELQWIIVGVVDFDADFLRRGRREGRREEGRL